MKKSIFLSLLSGLFLSLSFSSFNLWQLAWFSFIPLFLALNNQSLKKSLFFSFIWGLIFWSLCIYWLVHVTLIGQIILIVYLSLFFAAFGCLFYFSAKFPPLLRLIFLPCSWVLLEYLRSHLFTGFPWALLGFSQYKNLPLIQISEITGAWGVSFIVILFNTAFYLYFFAKSRIKVIIISLSVLFLFLIFGIVKLNQGNRQEIKKEIKVTVIQGNIPQYLKWDSRAVDFILTRYAGLTIAASKDGSDLVVWPEASVPGVLGLDLAQFERVFNLVKETKINLLVGAVSFSEEKYFNSAMLVDKNAKITGIYHKLHLVPFGEFIPFRNILSFLQTIAPIGDIERGKNFTIFKQPADFGVLICFEDLFPELSRQFVKEGAKFLINITNDAWYKQGSAPYQHFAASVFRAVENRVYLCRSANTGISGFIDPFGRISLLKDSRGNDIFVQGYKTENISVNPPKQTFYNRYGDISIIFFLLCAVSIIILSPKLQEK